MRELYGSIDMVDTMVGLHAEPPPRGFGFSDTAFRIFILMASRRLQSDRFLTVDYRPEIYSPVGLDWIDKNGMTSVILRNCPDLPACCRARRAPSRRSVSTRRHRRLAMSSSAPPTCRTGGFFRRPLLETIWQRRTHRVSRGVSRQGQVDDLPVFAERPLPLSELEEAVLIAVTGHTGLTMPDRRSRIPRPASSSWRSRTCTWRAHRGQLRQCAGRALLHDQ